MPVPPEARGPWRGGEGVPQPPTTACTQWEKMLLSIYGAIKRLLSQPSSLSGRNLCENLPICCNQTFVINPPGLLFFSLPLYCTSSHIRPHQPPPLLSPFIPAAVPGMGSTQGPLHLSMLGLHSTLEVLTIKWSH